jgi:hypothetical protein
MGWSDTQNNIHTFNNKPSILLDINEEGNDWHGQTISNDEAGTCDNQRTALVNSLYLPWGRRKVRQDIRHDAVIDLVRKPNGQD